MMRFGLDVMGVVGFMQSVRILMVIFQTWVTITARNVPVTSEPFYIYVYICTELGWQYLFALIYILCTELDGDIFCTIL